MGGEETSTAGSVSPVYPSPEGAMDLALAPHTYPIRGRILCWLFWKCWLNPFWWVLRLVCPKRNPYRRVVAVYDEAMLAALKARENDGRESEASKGVEGSGGEGRRGN